jgi:hypothetical protein
MKRRYEYRVEARQKRTKAIVAVMACYGDNASDAIAHATQWWLTQERCDHAAWCRITATRTGKFETV